MLSNFLIIPIVKGKIKVKLALAIPTGVGIASLLLKLAIRRLAINRWAIKTCYYNACKRSDGYCTYCCA